jgi:hypothetical protein
VGGNESIKIAKNRSKTVGKNEQDKIGKSWSIKVGKFKTETIGMASMQNVGLAKMVNIGGAYSLNVGAMMNTIVGINRFEKTLKSHSVSAGKEFAAVAGGGASVLRMDSETITLQVGESVLTLHKDGTITLTGERFEFEANGAIEILGKDVELN